jgi:hypothetical protein
VLGVAIVTLFIPRAQAAMLEKQVKAAYLYKLASFVDWPAPSAGQGEPFIICMVGRDDIAGLLEGMAHGQRISNRPIVIQRINPDRPGSPDGCAILFLGQGQTAADKLIAATRSMPVLTVTDRNTGTAGGVLEFLVRDGRVRFIVHQKLAEDRHLSLSSKLMAVAVAVDR